MGTVAENLNRIIQAKADIKTAIENKGVMVGDIAIDGYAAKIGEITGGAAPISIAATGIKLGNSVFETLPDGIDFNGVTDMKSMFYNCKYLKKLDLTPWDLSSVTNMESAFMGCVNLTELKMSGDVSNVSNVNEMFFSYSSFKAGTFYYDSNYDYSKIIEQLPSNWTAVPLE
jgi:surface protein